MTTPPSLASSRLTSEQRAALKTAVDAAFRVRENRGWARSTFAVTIDHFIIEQAVEKIVRQIQGVRPDDDC